MVRNGYNIMDTRHSRGAIIQFYKWACAQAVAYAESQRGGEKGVEEPKIKKGTCTESRGKNRTE